MQVPETWVRPQLPYIVSVAVSHTVPVPCHVSPPLDVAAALPLPSPRPADDGHISDWPSQVPRRQISLGNLGFHCLIWEEG